MIGASDVGSEGVEGRRIFRLPRRRAGRRPRRCCLCRACQAAERHHAHRRQRSRQSSQACRDQGSRRNAVAQGPRRQRHHAGQPRDLSDRAQRSGLSRRPRNLRYRQTHRPRAISAHGRPAECTGSRSTAVMSTARRSSMAISATSSSIIDFKNPEPPEEVGRWWMPGQWTAGGEKPDLGGHRPSLPSSDARWQPPLCQLLARRLRHSRHRGHDQAEIHLRPRLEPAISLADAYRASGAVPVARAPRHAGRR